MEVSSFLAKLAVGRTTGCRLGRREPPVVFSYWQLGMDYATLEVTERVVLGYVSGWRGPEDSEPWEVMGHLVLTQEQNGDAREPRSQACRR